MDSDNYLSVWTVYHYFLYMISVYNFNVMGIRSVGEVGYVALSRASTAFKTNHANVLD
jgi:hypothetical protein